MRIYSLRTSLYSLLKHVESTAAAGVNRFPCVDEAFLGEPYLLLASPANNIVLEPSLKQK